MAKLEELSELLVSEIRDFEVAVKKLEEIQKNKIQLDLQNLQKLFSDHREALNQNIAQNTRYLQMVEKLNNQIRSYLKRGLILVAVGLFLNLCFCALILYFIL